MAGAKRTIEKIHIDVKKDFYANNTIPTDIQLLLEKNDIE